VLRMTLNKQMLGAQSACSLNNLARVASAIICDHILVVLRPLMNGSVSILAAPALPGTVCTSASNRSQQAPVPPASADWIRCRWRAQPSSPAIALRLHSLVILCPCYCGGPRMGILLQGGEGLDRDDVSSALPPT